MEYSIGCPLDARTTAAIDQLPEHDWTPALKTNGEVDEAAQVAELTSLLRHSHQGDLLATWPADMRVFARRVKRPEGEQPELGQDAAFRYGSFVTNTKTGQAQWLDARQRTQAHVEDRIKELKACGAQRLPSKNYARNSAWLQLAAHAVTLLAWTRLLALESHLALAEPKTLRFRVLAAPARYVRHARKRHPEDPHRMGLGQRHRHRLDPNRRPPPNLSSTSMSLPAEQDPRTWNRRRPGDDTRAPSPCHHDETPLALATTGPRAAPRPADQPPCIIEV